MEINKNDQFLDFIVTKLNATFTLKCVRCVILCIPKKLWYIITYSMCVPDEKEGAVKETMAVYTVCFQNRI